MTLQAYYYLLWILLLAPFAWYVLKAFLDPAEIFSPPLFVCFGVNYLYVFGYLSAPMEMNQWFMEPDAYVLLLVLCVLSIYAFIVGHALALTQPLSERYLAKSPSEISFALCCLVLVVAYIAYFYFIAISGGFLAYYSAPHGVAGAWKDTTAYIYVLPNFMFTIVFVLFVRRRLLVSKNILEGTILWMTVAVLAFEAFVFGNRGDTIRFVLIFGITYILVGGRRPSRLKLIIPVAAALAAVIVFPLVRDALFLGSDEDLGKAVTTAVGGIAITTTESDRKIRFLKHETGSNLYLSAAVIKSTNETVDVDFGAGWLSIPVGFVPRVFWPEKHQVIARWFKQPLEVAEKAARWQVIPGSSTGGIADAFIRFWWAAPCFWALLGYVGGRLRKKARLKPMTYSVGYFVAYMIGLTYWVTQDAQGAFLGWFYFIVPLLTASFLPASRSVNKPSSSLHRTRGLEPSQATRALTTDRKD